MQILGLVMYNEAYKRLLTLWRYKFDVLIKIVGVVLVFVGCCVILPGRGFSAQALAPSLLGYLVWFYARFVISASASDLISEAYTGTLEQVYMSPIPSGFLLLARLFALLLSTTILIILPTLGMLLFWHITLPLRPEALLIFIITLTGLFGFALLLSGLSLVFKQISDAISLIQIFMLFLSGAMVPINHLPYWLELLARALPTTQGIVVLKALVFSGRSLPSLWSDGSMIWLMLNSLIYVCLGLLVYQWSEHIARHQGSLGQY